MARSVKKGPYVAHYLVKKIEQMQNSTKKAPIKTWSRRSMITPDFIGLKFEVHNGNKFIPVSVVEDMIGHKLGEFAPTRTFKGHAANKKAAAK